MRFFAAALFFFGVAASQGQTPEVPHKMQFAGITLNINGDARREIQKDVDALTQHPYYFNLKVERAKTYFPIIETIFKEERLPEDFKYLALQESALVADAVSSSNAVGFWQFKDFTAEEMGMRMDREVDERMNLVSATRSAARYLKKNNFQFNNWLLALQAYQMGAGGAKREVGDKYNGAKHMDINSKTYWYVKKYLAHKVAFEGAIEGEAELKMQTYETSHKTTLKELANELAADEEMLLIHNKWAKQGVVPGDKPYHVLVPVGSHDGNFTRLAASRPASANGAVPKSKETKTFPTFIEVNEIRAIVAMPGERITDVADRAGISLSALLKFNDLSIDHKILAGAHYFVAKKKKRAQTPYHKMKKGENLWMVSQHYGVQLKKIRKYNKLENGVEADLNAMLWLSSKKPVKSQVADVAELDLGAEFDWNNESSAPIFTGELNPEGLLDDFSTLSPNTLHGNTSDSLVEQTNPAEEPIYHEVKASDTFYSIARQYGVTIDQLMQWNQRQNYNLTIGEKLRLFKQE